MEAIVFEPNEHFIATVQMHWRRRRRWNVDVRKGFRQFDLDAAIGRRRRFGWRRFVKVIIDEDVNVGRWRIGWRIVGENRDGTVVLDVRRSVRANGAIAAA